jgi:hypothetical protein
MSWKKRVLAYVLIAFVASLSVAGRMVLAVPFANNLLNLYIIHASAFLAVFIVAVIVGEVVSLVMSDE